MVPKAREPERHTLDPLDQVVGRFGRRIAQMGAVPGGDLVLPTDEGASEGADLDRTRLVLEVPPQPLDEGDGEVGVVVVVDAADHLLGMPRGADLAPGIAGREQPEQLRSALVLKTFVGAGEQPPDR